MKITEIHIYGYGKIQDVKMDLLSPELQIFYGENEAGKSTVMSFIQSILFGFPTKNQTELRYEPKRGTQYGGSLLVETIDHGKVKIERVGGKAGGDVTVFYNDGSISHDLQPILKGMEKSLYKGIFSFNIMDIQNVQLIQVDQLGSYLFSSGFIGSDRIQKLLQTLEKESEALFKPNGRKPVINEQLRNMKELENEASTWNKKLQDYEQLIEGVTSVEKQIQLTQTAVSELRSYQKEVETMVAITPIVVEMEKRQTTLDALKPYKPFPIDGMIRLEKLIASQSAAESKAEKVKKSLQELNEKLSSLPLSPAVKENEKLIVTLLSNKHEYELAKQELEKVRNDLNGIDKEIDSLKRELKWNEMEEEEITNFDSSLPNKASLRELIRKQQELVDRKNRLDDHFLKAKEDVEHHEQTIKELEEKQLSNEQRNKWKEKMEVSDRSLNEQELLLQEKLLQNVELQMKEQNHIYTKQKQKQKQIQLFTIIFALLFSVWTFIAEQYLFTGVVLIISIFLLFVIGKLNDSSILPLELKKKEIENTIYDLQGQLFESGKDNGEKELIQRKLAEDDQIQQLLTKERFLFQQSEKIYNRIIEQFEQWEEQNYSFKMEWDKWVRDTKLNNIPYIYMEEAFEKATILKTNVEKRIRLYNRKMELEQIVTKWNGRMNEVAKLFKEDAHSEDNIFYTLPIKWKEYEEATLIQQQLLKKKEELEEELQHSNIEYSALKKKLEELYLLANVENEEAFREKEKIYQQAIQLEKDIFSLNNQLTQLLKWNDYTIETWYRETDWLQIQKQTEKAIVEKLEEERKLFQQKSSLSESIRTLENGTTYSEVVQKYEIAKAELKENAKRWATIQTTQQLLEKTMNYYRDVKLPKVLETASRYFHMLTNGNYVNIIDSHDEQTLIVEHKNGIRFLPKELSQGTIEQLYLSLRFAVASAWSKEHSFPFILDDTFVNFDHKRVEQSIKLLKELIDEGHQILFFTCHEQLKNQLIAQEQSNLYSLSNNIQFAEKTS